MYSAYSDKHSNDSQCVELCGRQREIVIGGFVDSDFANRFMHKIPVVYEPMKEMGKLAGEMIVKKIEDKNEKFSVKALLCEYDSNNFYRNQVAKYTGNTDTTQTKSML